MKIYLLFLLLVLLPSSCMKAHTKPTTPQTAVQKLRTFCDKYQGNLETTGYNRGPVVDAWNRALGAAMKSPYCATGTSAALKYAGVASPITQTAWARDFANKNEGVDAVDVFYGRATPPMPCVVGFVRSNGGHVGIGWELLRKVGQSIKDATMKLWEPNTSPDRGIGSQWDGAFTGYKHRTIKQMCSPWNAFRAKKFVPIS